MAAPHAAGVAALVVENHQDWSPGAVSAAVQASAQPLNDSDERYRCYGDGGRTSFFGFGPVDAAAAALK